MDNNELASLSTQVDPNEETTYVLEIGENGQQYLKRIKVVDDTTKAVQNLVNSQVTHLESSGCAMPIDVMAVKSEQHIKNSNIKQIVNPQPAATSQYSAISGGSAMLTSVQAVPSTSALSHQAAVQSNTMQTLGQPHLMNIPTGQICGGGGGNQPMALQQLSVNGVQYSVMVPVAKSGTNNMQMLSVPQMPFPSSSALSTMSDGEEPMYVNAKQYHRILKRREARARLEATGKIPKTRQKYLYESRHKHAANRARSCGGKFSGSTAKENIQDPENTPIVFPKENKPVAVNVKTEMNSVTVNVKTDNSIQMQEAPVDFGGGVLPQITINSSEAIQEILNHLHPNQAVYN